MLSGEVGKAQESPASLPYSVLISNTIYGTGTVQPHVLLHTALLQLLLSKGVTSQYSLYGGPLLLCHHPTVCHYTAHDSIQCPEQFSLPSSAPQHSHYPIVKHDSSHYPTVCHYSSHYRTQSGTTVLIIQLSNSVQYYSSHIQHSALLEFALPNSVITVIII